MSSNDNGEPPAKSQADIMREKRLRKLGTPASSPGSVASPQPDSPASSVAKVSKPNPPTPVEIPKPVASSSTATPQPVRRGTPAAPVKLDILAWEHSATTSIFNVTLDRTYAEQHQFKPVWLKALQQELEAEQSDAPKPLKVSVEIIDRLLIARLDVDPNTMSDDLDYLPVLASLPQNETVLEYLVGCWRRHNSIRLALGKKNYTTQDTQHVISVLDKIKELIISYAGLDLQDPTMFPQPESKPLGPPELVNSLLSLSSLTDPLSSSQSNTLLTASEVPQFLQDISLRFDSDGTLPDVLGNVIRLLCFNVNLARPEGLGGADASWRGVLSGLEALISVKPIAIAITKLPEWNPSNATAPNLELTSLMGPLLRLGVFGKEWMKIAETYFSDSERRTQGDIDSSNASLRGTLRSLQSSLFHVFNSIVRASPESREAVLQYFAKVVSLNVKRGGMQVDPTTVASDSFMINLQSVLLSFAEPFIDATYSKIDRIDPLYLARSDRVDVREETRFKATSDEVAKWAVQTRVEGGPAPNFISDIFYLTSAMNHYGLNRALQSFDDLHKQADDVKRHIEFLQSNMAGMPVGHPLMARLQAGIEETKKDLSRIYSEQFSYQVQLLDPEFTLRQLGFTNFLEAWLIRLVDPRKAHPKTTVEVPLPKEIPDVFRMLPEYFVEDIVDFLLFLMRNSPDTFNLSGKNELVIWALTFLRSTWYINNPFLKAKINETIFFGTLGYGREQNGVLGGILNSHPFALKHLIPALTSFYIEVEQTGASSQFYDKFNARRNIAHILKAVWHNPSHRQALKAEAQNMDKFVRFVNLMINDVTYLMDESLSELSQIYTIQQEMESPEWQNQPMQYRREREGSLRGLERHASSYVVLGRSTVEMLKIFTAETKEPFTVPEIVDKLAAMLDYNLEALAGPRCQNLKVKEREKYRFDPRALLSDILDIYLNLAEQSEFVRAVANDGRSYKKELFEQAAGIARRRVLKTDDEIERLRIFVVKVEEMKATIEAEEDLGEVPDEYLDPLMFTVMRDPVILPSSKVTIDRSTIKSHLLSDAKDPFNRSPLSIEEVVPNTELKAQIDAFLAERRNKATALDIPENNIVNMDMDIAD